MKNTKNLSSLLKQLFSALNELPGKFRLPGLFRHFSRKIPWSRNSIGIFSIPASKFYWKPIDMKPITKLKIGFERIYVSFILTLCVFNYPNKSLNLFSIITINEVNC